MFQQHQGESLSEAWARFKDLLQKVPHHGIDLWLQVQIFYDYVNPVTRRTINQSAGGKLRDKNTEESWALLEDLALYETKVGTTQGISLRNPAAQMNFTFTDDSMREELRGKGIKSPSKLLSPKYITTEYEDYKMTVESEEEFEKETEDEIEEEE
ncbi:hypothetical protein Tco_1503334 [Tanacetum coccineum]